MSLATVLLLALGTGCSSGSSESGSSASDSGESGSSEKGRGTEKPGGRAGAKASATKGTDGRPVDIVRAAVAKVRATSARIDETVVTRGRGEEFTLSLAGPFDLATGKGKLSVDFPGGAVDHMDEVFSGGKVYLTRTDPKGHWAVIDRDKARAHSLLRAPLNDPEHVLRQASAIRDVSDRGTTTIDGRPVHLYGGTLDYRTLTLGLADERRKQVDTVRKAMGGGLPSSALVWVDEKGRPARVELSARLNTTDVTATMNLTDFGRPVKVRVPDASRTTPTDSVSGVLPG
ncbi:hypothetical protein [Streptomyces sp. 5-6(2022)]|uniref:hypothetical protein n=1 Tax=Streptomyces sp. 5-6(2022) TaxID=2936510 RepID=UPI0023B8E501|nr:hypothetical protein [Streptomyces sp. 5-6(2022)]